jgi:hypothetical protein
VEGAGVKALVDKCEVRNNDDGSGKKCKTKCSYVVNEEECSSRSECSLLYESQISKCKERV